jgi:capsular polysaccharide biosynthesis protein
MPSHFGNSSFDVYQTLQKLSRDIDCGDGKDYRYIYISRRKADKRSMLNEGDLLCLLRNKLPFIELFLEDLSFKDQISIIKNASFIVAPHGAGLAWSIFQTEGILLEIFPPNYVNHCYASLPRNFGVKYISYYCDPEKTTNYYHPELSNSSFKIDLVHFEIFFESLKGELNS